MTIKKYILNVLKERYKKVYFCLFFIRTMPRSLCRDFIPWIDFQKIRLLKSLGVVKKDNVLCKLKNRYHGKRVFLIGTGPSLLIEDLEWLNKKNEYTFAVNSIYNIFNKTMWRPSFYCVGDYNSTIDAMKKNIKYEECFKDYGFISRKAERFVDYQIDKERIGVIDVNYLDHFSRGVESHSWLYSNDLIDYGMYDCSTVVTMCINIADFLGFKEVYLLGVDCSFSGQMPHIGDEKWEKDASLKQLNQTRALKRGFEQFEKLIRYRKIKVYNATRGGELEVFKRVNMDEIIHKI